MDVPRRAVAATVACVVALSLAVALGVGGSSGSGHGPATTATVAAATTPELVPSTPARASVLARMRSAIEDVVGADGSAYDATDDAGANLEGLEVAATGRSDGPRYLGVAHHRAGRQFVVELVAGDDLLHWRRVRTLQTDASQATLRRLPDGSWLLAWEQEPQNHVRLRHAASLAALLQGRFDATFDAPLTLAPTAEGTPDIRAVRLRGGLADSTIEVGFHYYRDRDVDREAEATLTDFRSWTARRRPDLDRALAARGLRGNFGDRDTFTWSGIRFEVVEGQRRKGDFGSWRTFLRDLGTGTTVPLRMRVRFGQRAFGNPTVSILPGPHGGTVLFTSAFAFQEGAPLGAGELLSWRRLR